MLYELATGGEHALPDYPNSFRVAEGNMISLQVSTLAPLPAHAPRELQGLICSMLSPDPRARPALPEVLRQLEAMAASASGISRGGEYTEAELARACSPVPLPEDIATTLRTEADARHAQRVAELRAAAAAAAAVGAHDASAAAAAASAGAGAEGDDGEGEGMGMFSSGGAVQAASEP